MTVVGQAGSVAESAERASELQPDVVLLDFRLTDGTGADAAAAIRRVRPQAKLIFLTREDSDVARFAALESGASGFHPQVEGRKRGRRRHPNRRVGRQPHHAADASPRCSTAAGSRRRQRESLTAREKEVLRLMAEGLSSRDIAGKLGISYTTVRTHIRSLGSKLGVHSKVEAIVKARELALVE